MQKGSNLSNFLSLWVSKVQSPQPRFLPPSPPARNSPGSRPAGRDNSCHHGGLPWSNNLTENGLPALWFQNVSTFKSSHPLVFSSKITGKKKKTWSHAPRVCLMITRLRYCCPPGVSQVPTVQLEDNGGSTVVSSFWSPGTIYKKSSLDYYIFKSFSSKKNKSCSLSLLLNSSGCNETKIANCSSCSPPHR